MYMKENNKDKIDIVITWVDGNDLDWQLEKNKFLGLPQEEIDVRARRFRKWNTFVYLFRGIEKYASWVNHIYLVTPNQVPEWLNTNHPKITVIDQNSIMPNDNIPTFNNCAIELMLHKIPNLSEHFVYLNDDMFIIKETNSTDFFDGNFPKDTVALAPTQAVFSDDRKGVYGIDVMCTRLIARNFSKKDILINCGKKLFDIRNGREIIKTIFMMPFSGITGFNQMHTAYSFCKQTYLEIWENEYDELKKTCNQRFRSEFGLACWVIRNWQISKGNFSVRRRSFSRFFDLHCREDVSELKLAIENQTNKMICINDNVSDEEFSSIESMVIESFKKIFPNKSDFEL